MFKYLIYLFDCKLICKILYNYILIQMYQVGVSCLMRRPIYRYEIKSNNKQDKNQNSKNEEEDAQEIIEDFKNNKTSDEVIVNHYTTNSLV